MIFDDESKWKFDVKIKTLKHAQLIRLIINDKVLICRNNSTQELRWKIFLSQLRNWFFDLYVWLIEIITFLFIFVYAFYKWKRHNTMKF
jgi:hypothetical protein